MAVIAYITDGKVVERILTHLGLEAELPRTLPARRPSSFEEPWADEEQMEEPWEEAEADEGHMAHRGRAPPD
jgi:hypothetical protein